MDFDSIKPLQERAKELQCLYEIENVFADKNISFNDVFNKILEIIPNGWQFPALCHAIIEFDNKHFFLENSQESEYSQCSELVVDNSIVGKIKVYYKDIPFSGECFLPEEQKLLNSIADRFKSFYFP